MYLINKILNPIFHLLFLPFAGREPVWALIWISLLTAVLALLIYRFFSSQDLIKQVKNRIKSHILEMRLFQQDPVLMGRAVRSARTGRGCTHHRAQRGRDERAVDAARDAISHPPHTLADDGHGPQAARAPAAKGTEGAGVSSRGGLTGVLSLLRG